MASNKDRLRERRERDRLRRQTETAREREVTTELEGARSDIVTLLLLSILAKRALASCTCAIHQYYACSPLFCLHGYYYVAKTLYTCGL